MTDDQLHTLRVIFGLAVDHAAHRFHDRLAAFYERAGDVRLKTWDELSDDDRNAYRSALADLAGDVELDRLGAAAHLLDETRSA